MKVLFIPEVTAHIDFLIPFLYELGYFRNKEKSRKYFKELINKIEKYLPILQHKPAPPYFYQFLNNSEHAVNLEYTFFKKNKNTAWYVFFTTYEEEETGDDIYLVCYIANNHTVAQHLYPN
jgi:hypothetical protein